MLDSISIKKGDKCTFETCRQCPLSIDNNGVNILCADFETLYPDDATDVVRKWAKEHQAKTRKDLLLEKFPNSRIDVTCAYSLGLTDVCDAPSCESCWAKEVE